MTATLVTAADAGDDEAHDVTLETTAGPIALGAVTADNLADITSFGAITDDNGGATNITAAELELTAGGDIGTITDFATEAGDAIEFRAGTLSSVSAVGTNVIDIHLEQTDATPTINLAATALNIDGADAGQFILKSAGDIDASSETLAQGAGEALEGGDSIALNAAGTLTLPSSITTAGNVRLTGDDVLDSDAAPGDYVITVTANDLYFSSNTTTNTTLDTTVATLTAELTEALTGADLVITETDAITLTDVDTVIGAVDVTAGGAVVRRRDGDGDQRRQLRYGCGHERHRDHGDRRRVEHRGGDDHHGGYGR